MRNRNIIHQIFTLNLYLFISFNFSFPTFASTQNQSTLTRGSHLSVENYKTELLHSPDHSFACGFYKVATNAFIFAIWFTSSVNQTVAWTANRDHPVNGHGSRVTMQKDGILALTDAGGAVVWSTDINGGQRAKLLNSGNLVVDDSNGEVKWQSFDSPTDTLLPSQLMTKDTALVSASALDLLGSGSYKFFFDSDSVLRLIYIDPNISSIYWPPAFTKDGTSYNSSKIGVLDEKGHFVASDQTEFTASDFDTKIKRRLTLDYDGNLRLYSLNESSRKWSVSWVAISEPCIIHGACGPNGICSYTRMKPECSCPPGFEMNDPSSWRKGCRRMSGNEIRAGLRAHELRFVEVRDRDFYGFEFERYITSVSLRECKKLCINHSFCEAFVYRAGSGECYPKSILFNGQYSNRYSTYLKFPRSAKISQVSASRRDTQPVCPSVVKEVLSSNTSYTYMDVVKVKWAYFYWFLSIFFALEAVFILSGWWFMFRKDQKTVPIEEGFQLLSSQFRRFTYAELKTATKNFTDVVGRGGSGTVYKGVLNDGKVVAVKKLEDVIQGEEELQAELSLIGRINHKNLVRMIGYCSESSKRLLVSEFVQLGSLDKVLFDDDNSHNLVVKWSDRYRIALGVVQGLAYLHHECLEWIIHCDVKPENILLDDEFEPKIADFGLVKLLNRSVIDTDSSMMIRGTRGYIAPEWALNLPITGKVDVYSFGVVLLELVKGSRVSNWTIEGEDNAEMVLTRSLVLLKEKLQSKEMGWIEKFVDTRLNGQFDEIQALMLIKIGVRCLEEERNKRPTMNSVFQMMISCDD